MGGENNPQRPTPDLDLSRLTGWANADATGGSNIHSKAVLEFDFVPTNDLVSFRYVFSSEEYERWACSQYNDVFGWFISGPGIPTNINGPFTNNAMNIAFIPGSMAPVCINAVNNGRLDVSNANGPDFTDLFGPCFAADSNWRANAQYYRYNGGQWPFPGAAFGEQLESPYNTDPYYIAHNGMTVVLTASAAVRIGQRYHMKMGIANARDAAYPCAVFIEENSFRSSDRFTLTVDEGPNVSTSGSDPVLFESDVDSVYLRFNRWGGFYLDEHLHISVEGDALAGVDYMPVLPDSIHFNQLDSAVVIPIAVPARSGGPRELVINLITSNGDKVMRHGLAIEERISTRVRGQDAATDRLALFPNPVQNILHVALPHGTEGRTELQVLDMAGRVVAQQVLNGTSKTTIDITDLPNGLYMLKANIGGRVATARVSVRH